MTAEDELLTQRTNKLNFHYVRNIMYSYWHACSVLYILCQLAFSGYPDWGFSVLFPQL